MCIFCVANSPDRSKESKDVSKVFCLTRLLAILMSKYTNQVKYSPDGNYDVSVKGVKITITILYKIMRKKIWPSITSFRWFCISS